MTVLFYKALLWLAVAVLRVVDTIFDLFLYLSGINKVGFGEGNQTMDILSVFTSNSGVTKVFGLIVLIGIGVGAIFTMISMSKNMVTGKKTQGKIFTQYFASILGMLVAFMVLLLAVSAVSTVLGLVSAAFTLGGEINEGLSVGSKIMTTIVGQEVNIHDGSISDVVNRVVGMFGPNPWTGWEDIDKGLQTGSEPLFPGGSNAIRAFPYFMTLLCAGVLLWCSFSAVLSLIVRLFDIVFLQLAMPLSLACYPLDDGARFKLWRETMISKLVLAFGTIIAVNVYLILINPIMKISLPNQADGKLENFFRILLVVCGGFTISAGQMLFARLMGTDASEGRQMQQNFKVDLEQRGDLQKVQADLRLEVNLVEEPEVQLQVDWLLLEQIFLEDVGELLELFKELAEVLEPLCLAIDTRQLQAEWLIVCGVVYQVLRVDLIVVVEH